MEPVPVITQEDLAAAKLADEQRGLKRGGTRTRKRPAVAKPRKPRRKRPVLIQKDIGGGMGGPRWSDLKAGDTPIPSDFPVGYRPSFDKADDAIKFIRDMKLPAGRYRVVRVLRQVTTTPITVQTMLFTEDVEVVALKVEEEPAPTPAGGE